MMILMIEKQILNGKHHHIISCITPLYFELFRIWITMTDSIISCLPCNIAFSKKTNLLGENFMLKTLKFREIKFVELDYDL